MALYVVDDRPNIEKHSSSYTEYDKDEYAIILEILKIDGHMIKISDKTGPHEQSWDRIKRVYNCQDFKEYTYEDLEKIGAIDTKFNKVMYISNNCSYYDFEKKINSLHIFD